MQYLKANFQRIRRNCTSISDYHQQALVLKTRFLDKGYKENDIDDTIQKVGDLNRDLMIYGPKKVHQVLGDRFNYSKISGYSNQHYSEDL